jgi:hypothetical protein
MEEREEGNRGGGGEEVDGDECTALVAELL